MITNVYRRAIAILVTSVVCFGTFASFRASAVTVSTGALGITYEVMVKKESSKRIAIKIKVKTTIKIRGVDFLITGDSNCSFDDEVKCDTSSTARGIVLQSGVTLMTTTIFDSNKSGEFTVTCYADTKDSADNKHTFEIGLIDYVDTSMVTHSFTGNVDTTISTGGFVYNR